MKKYLDSEEVRKDVIKLCVTSDTGHLASSLSCVEIMCAIYNRMEPGDQFLLSKGHAAATLYVILNKLYGLDISKFGNGLSTHPHRSSYIFCSSGSLGGGLGIATGMSLSNRWKKIYVLLGDAEFQEGSIWESLMFMSNNDIHNVIPVIDHNDMGATGRIDINLAPKISGFDFKIIECNGHNVKSIDNALSYDVQKVVLCRTTKGKGIPLLEHNGLCHVRKVGWDELPKRYLF